MQAQRDAAHRMREQCCQGYPRNQLLSSPTSCLKLRSPQILVVAAVFGAEDVNPRRRQVHTGGPPVAEWRQAVVWPSGGHREDALQLVAGGEHGVAIRVLAGCRCRGGGERAVSSSRCRGGTERAVDSARSPTDIRVSSCRKPSQGKPAPPLLTVAGRRHKQLAALADRGERIVHGLRGAAAAHAGADDAHAGLHTGRQVGWMWEEQVGTEESGRALCSRRVGKQHQVGAWQAASSRGASIRVSAPNPSAREGHGGRPPAKLSSQRPTLH